MPKYFTISNLIAFLVLVAAFVLVLVNRMDLITAILIGALAVAFLIRHA